MANNARAGPAHQRVLPAATSLQDVKVDPPFLALCAAGLHGISGGEEDPYGSVLELNW